MTDISVQPLGHFVLIETMEVKTVSEGGIHLPSAEKEQAACEFGIIKAFGPTAFIGIAGCDPESYSGSQPQSKMTPYQIWGVDVGDKVEYERYEGKKTSVRDAGQLRYIPDMKIKGKITGDFEVTKADF